VKIRYLLSFVAFGLVTAFAVYYIASLGVRVAPPDNRVNVSMEVKDTNSLVVDSNVLLRGVPVGKVTGIHASVQTATVDFYVDKEYPIPVDTEVRLENLSALGESYIGLVPRSASGPMLRDGQKVSTQDITAPASISELATSVVHVLNQMDPGQLTRLVDEADRALPEPDAALPNLTRASMLLQRAVKSMDGRGSQTLRNFQTLLQNADWVGPAIAQVSPGLQAAGKEVDRLFENAYNVVVRPIGSPEVARRFKGFLDRVQNLLDTRSPDLKVIAEAFMPYMQGIAASLMNVDTSQMLSNVLNGVPEDGVVTLHLNVQNP
jgi:phospholipid/cholesterol/gamma-HCH transport system substrate-binding protein